MKGIIYLQNVEFANFILKEMIEDGIFGEEKVNLSNEALYFGENGFVFINGKNNGIISTDYVDTILQYLEFVYDIDINDNKKIGVSYYL